MIRFCVSSAILFALLLTGPKASAEPFAGYDKFCGVRIIVASNPRGASASLDYDLDQVIYVDPKWIDDLDAFRIFTIAHECARIKLGQTLLHGTWFRYRGSPATTEEAMEDDCWAAKHLVKSGNAQVLEELTMVRIRGMHHLSGTARMENIVRCGGVP